MLSRLERIRYFGGHYLLDDWDLIKVSGEDRERFFQGQLTNDIKSLDYNESQLTARLNRTGQLQGFFYLIRKEENLYFLIPNKLTDKLLEDFNKYIIMDDVELEAIDKKFTLNLGFESFQGCREDELKVSFYGELGILSLSANKELDEISIQEMEELRRLHGAPRWGEEAIEGQLVNETTLNQYAVDYNKGCFLGQETAAKIQVNRGASKYPMLVQLDSGKIISRPLKREERVEGRKIELEEGLGIVSHHPFYKAENFADKAKEVYERAVDFFQDGHEDTAITLLERAIIFDPSFADAYESLGVILGRQEKFEEGIGLMDKLLEVDPDSIMAHTNKSLYLMRLGKIEEAEEEKSLATVKSFKGFGKQAETKKLLEEEKRKKEEELKQREGMFLQVLEIDEEDTIANFGMGDISFHRKEYDKAITFLKKVISIDENYSSAYLVLGKSLEGAGLKEDAREVFEKGINIASKRGDMMPANEMQSRLSKL